jgi:hypothetical protein
VDGLVATVTADGAYDGDPAYEAVAARHPDADVIIPPHSTAVPTETAASQRDLYIKVIEENGRRGWQRQTGYGRGSPVETAMFRYKTIIGRSLHARTLSNQRTEAKIGYKILNRMTSLGRPVSIRFK